MLMVAALAVMGAMHLSARRPPPAVDVQAYHFRVVLPDTGTVIHAAARIEFTSRTDTLALDLVGMTVDSVTGGVFTHDGTTLRIATTARTISVYYHGSPRDGLIIRNNARGRRSFFGDNWPNRARFWLPTVDHPSDKARVSWDVVAPAGMEVVTTRTGDRAIPTYCMVVGVTEMTVSRRGRTEVWAYPEDSAFADSVPFRRAPEILAAAIFYNEAGYVQRRTGEGVVRHEVAHQWFGDSAYWRVMHGSRASYLRSTVTARPIIDTTIASGSGSRRGRSSL